jgi:methylmalonyl-CoA mutase cobalamin-binding subunit
MAAMSEAYDLTCVIHLHSTYSDGSGTVPQIARAAQRAGIDVVLLTDHDTLEAKDRGEERWYDDVLVLVGEEVSPRDRDHFLAFGIDKIIDPRLSGPEICQAVAAAGGFGFGAHPFSRGFPPIKRPGIPWGDPDSLPGIELWSFLNDTGERVRGPRDAARMILAPQRAIGGPVEDNLREWDRLCQTRRVVAIGGLDAHQFGIRIAGRVPLRLMGYKRSFKQLHTHVLCERAPTRELQHDRALIYDALREGRCYIANDEVADARGFAFSHMGEELPFEPGHTVHAHVPETAQIRLLRDGEIITTEEAQELNHPIERPGVYRVEVRLRNRPWIYSNPVYFRTYS